MKVMIIIKEYKHSKLRKPTNSLLSISPKGPQFLILRSLHTFSFLQQVPCWEGDLEGKRSPRRGSQIMVLTQVSFQEKAERLQ